MSSSRPVSEGTYFSQLYPDAQNEIVINRDTVPQLGSSKSSIKLAFNTTPGGTELDESGQIQSWQEQNEPLPLPEVALADESPGSSKPSGLVAQEQGPRELSTERLAYHALHLNNLISGPLSSVEDVADETLDEKLQSVLICLIKEKHDFFTWSHVSLTALDDPSVPSGQRVKLVSLLIDQIYESTIYLDFVEDFKSEPKPGARLARKEAICRLVLYSFLDQSGDHFNMSIKALGQQAQRLGYDNTLRPLFLALFKPLTAEAVNLWP